MKRYFKIFIACCLVCITMLSSNYVEVYAKGESVSKVKFHPYVSSFSEDTLSIAFEQCDGYDFKLYYKGKLKYKDSKSSKQSYIYISSNDINLKSINYVTIKIRFKVDKKYTKWYKINAYKFKYNPFEDYDGYDDYVSYNKAVKFDTTDDGVEIKWLKAAKASKYDVYFAQDNSKFKKIATTKDTKILLTDLEEDSAYYVYIVPKVKIKKTWYEGAHGTDVFTFETKYDTQFST